MTLHVTYCSRKKSPQNKELPALQRYLSDRIEKIHKKAEEQGQEFSILSGKYGLLKPDDKIPYYDKLLTEEDLPKMKSRVEEQLQSRNIEKIVYHTRKVKNERVPYFELIKHASVNQGITFEKRII